MIISCTRALDRAYTGTRSPPSSLNKDTQTNFEGTQSPVLGHSSHNATVDSSDPSNFQPTRDPAPSLHCFPLLDSSNVADRTDTDAETSPGAVRILRTISSALATALAAAGGTHLSLEPSGQDLNATFDDTIMASSHAEDQSMSGAVPDRISSQIGVVKESLTPCSVHVEDGAPHEEDKMHCDSKERAEEDVSKCDNTEVSLDLSCLRPRSPLNVLQASMGASLRRGHPSSSTKEPKILEEDNSVKFGGELSKVQPANPLPNFLSGVEPSGVGGSFFSVGTESYTASGLLGDYNNYDNGFDGGNQSVDELLAQYRTRMGQPRLQSRIEETLNNSHLSLMESNLERGVRSRGSTSTLEVNRIQNSSRLEANGDSLDSWPDLPGMI